MKQLFLAGRILLGGFFLLNGARHFTNVTAMSAYAALKGVPWPMAAVLISGVLLLIGGVTLLLGIAPRAGIAALLIFLVPVTVIMHGFWAETGAARMADLGHFMKNVGLTGAILMLLAVPLPWPYSAEARARFQREVEAH